MCYYLGRTKQACVLQERALADREFHKELFEEKEAAGYDECEPEDPEERVPRRSAA